MATGEEEFCRPQLLFLTAGRKTERCGKTIIINGALKRQDQSVSPLQIPLADVPYRIARDLGEVESVDRTEEFAHENSLPVLPCIKQQRLTMPWIRLNGWLTTADTATLRPLCRQRHYRTKERDEFANVRKTCRASRQFSLLSGGIGDLYNFQAHTFPDTWLLLLGRQLGFWRTSRQTPAQH